ncbi:nitroreductase family protein [Larkinella soli]|uniref:nitroreductase family protein n=1 Tax=Larkinella soli TaxID=1770527 RepID=UPI000FFB2F8E|nr:nitroreductase family protein [Larkinella soli]
MIRKIHKKYKHYKKVLVNDKLPHLCYRSSRLSSLYYFLFDHSFDREHQAVLSGKIKHIRESKNTEGNYFLLVRNIHRIEKGLLMRPQRPVFAKDYIKETIDNFLNLYDRNQLETNPQMKWFRDVLSDYFAKAATDPFVQTQYQRYLQKVNAPVEVLEAEPVKSVPYRRLDTHKSSITFDEFYKLTRHRRSVRWFLDKPVERERIDKAVLAANQSPSACNRQPFEFHIFDDPEMVKKLIDFPMGTRGYGHSIPVFVVLVGNLDAYYNERDRHVIYIDASLASMSFMLALETMGISSVSINWPDIEEREFKMESFLKLQKHQRPLMCMGIGYPDPDGMVAFSEKRSLNQIRIYNR